MNPETKIQRAIQIALSENDVTVWRNEVGRYWTGKVLHRDGNQVTLNPAHMVPVGLCVGSSDLLAITPVEITPDMVGSTVGVFTAVEVKTTKGRPSKEQVNFIEHIREKGGRAGIARSPAEALDIAQGGTE